MASTGARKSDGVWAFFGLTYLLTALTFGLMAILQIPGPALEGNEAGRPISYVFFLIGGFSPSIAGLVLARVTGGRQAVRDLWRRSVQFGLGLRWYLIGIGIILLAQGAQVIAVLVGGEPLVRPEYLSQPLIILGNVPALLLLGPVSEEYGWRGFALDRLLARWSRPLANLVLGLFWAFWHLPLFFIPGTSQSRLGQPGAAFAIFALQAVALTVIYTWVYRKTNRSIWSAIFLHFMTAFAAFVAGGFIEGGGSFIHWATVGVYVAIALGITVAEDLAPRGGPAPA